MEAEIRIKGLNRLVTLGAFGLLAAAVARELSLPSGLRTWHGQLWGVIPYDLRPPTLERIRAAVWNPEVDTIFTGHPFGVGWYVNFGALIRRALALSARTGDEES